MTLVIPDVQIDAAVDAWGQALLAIATADPRMRQYPGRHDTHMVFTGSAEDSTNGVFCLKRGPDAVEIGRLAQQAACTARAFARPVPWCVQVRGRPTEAVVRAAAAYGLTEQSWEPFLIRDLGARPPATADCSSLTVRVVSGAEHELYVRTLAAGFGTPVRLFRDLVTPAVMDAPGITAYLGEVDGRAVATALGIVTGAHVGVFNVSTVPDDRRRGFGARITEHTVARGIAAGAGTAYLRASDHGMSVYRALGFLVAEHWTYLTAP